MQNFNGNKTARVYLGKRGNWYVLNSQEFPWAKPVRAQSVSEAAADISPYLKKYKRVKVIPDTKFLKLHAKQLEERLADIMVV